MIGRTLGSFRVVSELGAGGMGVIYTAEHQMLGKRAAVKVLRPEMSRDREIVGRFFNEAKAVTAIDHPGLVDVYDFGYTDDGAAFIVMELLSGESLAARLEREHRIPLDLMVALLRQLCGALGAAHERHIVHRDLKPDNIFLVRDPDVAFGVRAKVLDFGIAKLAPELGGLGTATRTGVLLGTPLYMAPEQCRGAGEVDHRADIYALGVILFEMACGQVPFTGAGLGEVIAKHQYVAPPAPRSLVPELPVALESLILRMLAKDPDQRPQSLAEVMYALDGRVATTTTTVATLAPPRSDVHAVAPVTQPRRRKPPWRLVGGTLGLVAAVTTTGMLLRSGPRADAPFDHLDLLPASTAFVAAFDVAKIADAPRWQRIGTGLLAAFDRSDGSRPLTQLRLSCDLDLARDVHWAMFVVDGSAARTNEGALIIDGAWSRAKLEHCISALKPGEFGQPLPRELALFDIQRYGDMYIRWLAPEIAALSFSHDSVPMLQRLKVHASRPEDRPALEEVLHGVDHDAAMWAAGTAAQGFPLHLDPTDNGALDSATQVVASFELAGDHGVLHVAATEPAGRAAELQRAFTAWADRMRPNAPIVDAFHAIVQGDAFVLDAQLGVGPLAAVAEAWERVILHDPGP